MNGEWPNPNGLPPVSVPTWGREAERARAWKVVNTYFPNLTLPADKNIGLQPLYRRVTFATNLTANVAQTERFQFGAPTVVFSGTATAIRATDLPVGRDPRDTFTVDLVRSNGNKLTQAPVLGSTLFGTAQRPALYGEGWSFNSGDTLVAEVTPNIANLTQIDLVLWVIQINGPFNTNE